jgi:uncharacterized membrane protein (UPF0182 family)
VIRGNVLVIPVEETLLYVEPIYLQAETAAYPELRLVVLMHGDNLSYGDTFEDALKDLLGGAKKKVPSGIAIHQESTSSLGLLIQRANKAFENYLQFLGEKRFSEASESLNTLQDTLQRLTGLEGLADVEKVRSEDDKKRKKDKTIGR